MLNNRDHIKKIGSRKFNLIPMKVYQDNEWKSYMGAVLGRLRTHFSVVLSVYKKPHNLNDDFHENLYNEALNQKIDWENKMSQPDYKSDMLNRELSFDGIDQMTKRVGLVVLTKFLLSHRNTRNTCSII